MRLPEQFITVFGHDGFKIEVDQENSIVKIQGIRYCFEFFDVLENPNTESFYQMSRTNEMSVFQEYRKISETDDGEIVVKQY